MAKHNIFEGVNEDAFREYLNDVSGREYWKASHFLGMGFSEEFVNSVTHDHITDPDEPMNRIFDTAKVDTDPKGMLESMIDPHSEKYTKEHLVAVADLACGNVS